MKSVEDVISFTVIGKQDNVVFSYGVLSPNGFSVRQLDALPRTFACVLLCGDVLLEETQWRSLFRTLISAGCRSATLVSESPIELETLFNKAANDLGGNCSDVSIATGTVAFDPAEMYDILFAASQFDRDADASNGFFLELGADRSKDILISEFYGDPPKEYTICIRIVHPSMNVREITDLLKLTPRHAWSRGDLAVTPRNMSLGRNRAQSYWALAYKVDAFGYKDIDSPLLRLASQLVAHERFFSRIVNEGGSCGLNLGFSGDAHIGFTVSSGCLKMIYDAHFDLEVEFFSARQNLSSFCDFPA